jgi:serine/threonine protein kinase/Flp pilus assembly protein TadD
MDNGSKLEAIFFTALEKQSPAERNAYLDEACAGDDELRRQVERMLAAHAAAGSFLESPPLDLPPTCGAAPIAEGPGTVIGPYKLLEQIGEGGFGLVFVAEQQRPVRRQVGLKIIKPGMDTRQVIARFEAERQALALMDHPNIAKVFDAGTTDSGRPYFVMELVRGVPIAQYCDDHQLTVRERLELFVTLCRAIQHAHQKGIIHRDVKPTNVLVTLHDGRPVPKVIDFGVAKALNQQLTERSIYTQFAQMIGTPLYMSPEQAEMNGLDIDTRSDIYSLGVVLYELLTGTTPFDRERLKQAAADEIRRIVREDEPLKPSSRLSKSGVPSRTTPAQGPARQMGPTDMATIAANRGTEPRRLTALVRGELDWIAMKCLEKDRNRRYETANALAADVEHYLHDEPVEACPPSIAYRMRKFARRHVATLSTVAAVLVTIMLALATSTILIAQQRDAARAAAESERLAAQDAVRERQRAEANLRVAHEAVDKLLTEAAQQVTNKPHMQQIRRRLLEDAVEFYQGFLQQKSRDPQMRWEMARAYTRVGVIHNILGNRPDSETAMRQAVALLEKLSAEFPAVREYREDLAYSRSELAGRLMDANKHEERLEVCRLVLSDYKTLVADFPTVPRYHELLASAHTGLAMTLRDLGRYPEAEQNYRQAIAMLEKIRFEFPNAPLDRRCLSGSHLWWGVFLLYAGRLPEAEPELRQALAICEQLLAEKPDDIDRQSDLAHVQFYVANLLRSIGKPHEAAQYFQRAIDVREKLCDDFPDDEKQWSRAGYEYADFSKALQAMGRTQEAEEALRRSIAVRQKLVHDHPGVYPHPQDLGAGYYHLGLLLHETRRPQEAAEAFQQALQLFAEGAEKFPNDGGCQVTFADALANCPALQFRDPDRAIKAAKRAIQLRPLDRWCWRVLGAAQFNAGKWQESIDSLNKVLELHSRKNEALLLRLAIAHRQLGRQHEARAWYDDAVKSMEKDNKDEELIRLRAEAAELFGIAETAADLTPTTNSKP